MNSEVEVLRNFGRRIATEQGWDPTVCTIDLVEFGRAARYAIGRRRPVPNYTAFSAAHPATSIGSSLVFTRRPTKTVASDVLELRRQRILTRLEARAFLGLPTRWWHRFLWLTP